MHKYFCTEYMHIIFGKIWCLIEKIKEEMKQTKGL